VARRRLDVERKQEVLLGKWPLPKKSRLASNILDYSLCALGLSFAAHFFTCNPKHFYTIVCPVLSGLALES
jgi:hypothetical protein